MNFGGDTLQLMADGTCRPFLGNRCSAVLRKPRINSFTDPEAMWDVLSESGFKGFLEEAEFHLVP